MDALGARGPGPGPLPPAQGQREALPGHRLAAAEANLIVARSEAMLGLHHNVAMRLTALFHDMLAASPTDAFVTTPETAPGDETFEASGQEAPAAPTPDRALQDKAKGAALPVIRTHRPPANPAQRATAAPDPAGTRDLSRMTDSIIPFAMESVLNRTHRDEAVRRRDAAKFLLLVLKAHGAYVYEHCTRLVDLAMALSAELGLDDDETQRAIEDGLIFKDAGEVGYFLTKESPRQKEALTAYLAGVEMAQDSLLHDVGKIHVPEEILYKPGPLTKEEFGIMQMHPIWGAEILAKIPPLHHAIPVTRHHHERWDGEGYPDRLAGTGIPLAARVVSVVDTFDALISDRPYRKALPLEEVVAIIERNRETQFDPAVAEAFLRIVPRVWTPERQY